VERALDDRRRPTPQAHGLKLPGSLDLVLTRAVARTSHSRQKDARTFWREVKTALRGPAAAAAKAPQTASAVNASLLQSWSEPAAANQAVLAPPPQPAIELPPAMPVGVAPPLPQPRLAAPTPLPAATLPDPIAADVRPGRAPASAPLLRVPLLAEPAASRTPFVADSPEPGLAAGPPFFRTTWIVLAGAALMLAAVLSVFVALTRTRQTFAGRVVAPVAVPAPSSAPAPSLAASSIAPAVAPSLVAPPVVPSSTLPSSTPSVATSAAPSRSTRPAAAASHTGHFSPAAARSALHATSRKVARCRHARFWGNGYATVLFANDGSVDQVLVDPPFSMTVAGQCVAQALSSARMPSFGGRSAFFRLRFYIAAR
jgi:hypothetical protein